MIDLIKTPCRATRVQFIVCADCTSEFHVGRALRLAAVLPCAECARDVFGSEQFVPRDRMGKMCTARATGGLLAVVRNATPVKCG
jgi:hypothetical protein